MKLGMEVGLASGNIVLDGDAATAPPPKVTLIFGRCLLWPNGCQSQLLLSTCTLFYLRRMVTGSVLPVTVLPNQLYILVIHTTLCTRDNIQQ